MKHIIQNIKNKIQQRKYERLKEIICHSEEEHYATQSFPARTLYVNFNNYSILRNCGDFNLLHWDPLGQTNDLYYRGMRIVSDDKLKDNEVIVR